MSTRYRDALELAKKTRLAFSNEEKSVEFFLRECKTICRILGISEKHQWIDLELNGYDPQSFKDRGESIEKMPKYRKIAMSFYDLYNRPVVLDYKMHSIAGVDVLFSSIAEIESFTKNGLTIHSSSTIDTLNDFAKEHLAFSLKHDRVTHAEISSSEVLKIVNAVKNLIHGFLDDLILELEYGRIPENIFENIRKEVDEKLTKLCPNAIEKLPIIYEQLSTNEEVVFSQIGSTCRQIINDVADSLFPPQNEPVISDGKKIQVDAGKPLNRILTKIKNEIDSDSEVSLFSSMFEYVDNFLHSLHDFASKGDHSKFQKSDATRCIVYTYLLLGDILHYYVKKNN